jgi:glyoxylase-like metal-dependent hydrolase (beta-lactamase superfamily II)
MPVVFRTTGTVSGPEFFLRSGSPFRRVKMPVTCAVIERPDGLVLIDTGWSREQCAWPNQNPGFATRIVLGMDVKPEDALASQLISMGYEPGDVRHIIATHLHLDHVGGAVDFPHAKVHLTSREWKARARGLRGGYDARAVPFTDRMELHELTEEGILGFGASKDLFGDGSMVLLDASGHTDGSTAVAVRLNDRWMIHVGDACMFREQYRAPGPLPLYARTLTHDRTALERTWTNIRTAETDHGATIVPSHDPKVFEELPTAPEKGWKTEWDLARKKSSNGKNGKGRVIQQARAGTVKE